MQLAEYTNVTLDTWIRLLYNIIQVHTYISVTRVIAIAISEQTEQSTRKVPLFYLLMMGSRVILFHNR